MFTLPVACHSLAVDCQAICLLPKPHDAGIDAQPGGEQDNQTDEPRIPTFDPPGFRQRPARQQI